MWRSKIFTFNFLLTCFFSPWDLLQRFFRKRKWKCCQQIKTPVSPGEFFPGSVHNVEPFQDSFHGENLSHHQVVLHTNTRGWTLSFAPGQDADIITADCITCWRTRGSDKQSDSLFLWSHTFIFLKGRQRAKCYRPKKVYPDRPKSPVFRRTKILVTNNCESVSHLYPSQLLLLYSVIWSRRR